MLGFDRTRHIKMNIARHSTGIVRADTIDQLHPNHGVFCGDLARSRDAETGPIETYAEGRARVDGEGAVIH